MRRRVWLAAALVLAGAGSARASIDSVKSSGLWCGNACYGDSVWVKQGTTVNLTLEGEWMDYCQAAIPAVPGIKATEVKSAGLLSRKCLVTVSLAAGVPLGTHGVTISHKLGADTLHIKVARNGVVTGIDPSTATGGRTTVHVLSGSNLGNARVEPSSDRYVESVELLPDSTETAARVKVTWKTLQQQQVVGLRLYEKGLVPINTYGTFRHITVAPNDAVRECTSDPGAGTPIDLSPANNAQMQFPPNSPGQTTVTLSWRGVTPSTRFLVHIAQAMDMTRTTRSDGPAGPVSGAQFFRDRDIRTEPGQSSIQVVLPRPGTYRWTVRIDNCGTPSPAAQSTFTLR